MRILSSRCAGCSEAIGWNERKDAYVHKQTGMIYIGDPDSTGRMERHHQARPMPSYERRKLRRKLRHQQSRNIGV